MKTVVHVNQHVIRANQKSGKRNPPLTVKTYKANTYAFEVEITGPCRVVYQPDNPLSCGARVWIETDHAVIPIQTPVPKMTSPRKNKLNSST